MIDSPEQENATPSAPETPLAPVAPTAEEPKTKRSMYDEGDDIVAAAKKLQVQTVVATHATASLHNKDDWHGRDNRKEFLHAWLGFLWKSLLFGLVSCIITIPMNMWAAYEAIRGHSGPMVLSTLVGCFFGIICFVWFGLPYMKATVRRVHDFGWDGKFSVIIPTIVMIAISFISQFITAFTLNARTLIHGSESSLIASGILTLIILPLCIWKVIVFFMCLFRDGDVGPNAYDTTPLPAAGTLRLPALPTAAPAEPCSPEPAALPAAAPAEPCTPEPEISTAATAAEPARITWRNVLSCSGLYSRKAFWIHWGITWAVALLLCMLNGEIYLSDFHSVVFLVAGIGSWQFILVLPAFVKRLRDAGKPTFLPYLWWGIYLFVCLLLSIVNPLLKSYDTHLLLFYITHVLCLVPGGFCFVFCCMPGKQTHSEAAPALFGADTRWYAGLAAYQLLWIYWLAACISSSVFIAHADKEELKDAFVSALHRNDVSFVEKILNSGRLESSELNSALDKKRIRIDENSWRIEDNDEGQTVLRIAIAENQDAMFRLLLNHPQVDVNAHKALELAAELNRSEMVQTLLQHPRFDIYRPDQDGHTPLENAVRHDKDELLQQMMQRPSFDLNQSNVLHYACAHGKLDLVRRLLEKPGININQAGRNDGNTPLHEAARHNEAAIVELLLNHPDIDPNRTNNSNKTARKLIDLYSYHYGTSTESARLLDKAALPAIFKAIQDGDEERVKSLLASDDDSNATDTEGNTPLHAALNTNNQGIIKLLLNHKHADINQSNNAGDTALHIAATRGKTDAVKHLLGVSGINILCTNKRGKTPLDCARAGYNSSCVLLLAEAEDALKPAPAPRSSSSSTQSSGSTYTASPEPEPEVEETPQPTYQPQQPAAEGGLTAQTARLWAHWLRDHFASNDISYIYNCYAPTIYLLNFQKNMSQEELYQSQIKYINRWSYRSLTLHDVAWGQNRVEIRFRYRCSNSAGKTASGFSKTTFLITPEGRINGFADDSNTHNFPDFSPYVGSPIRLEGSSPQTAPAPAPRAQYSRFSENDARRWVYWLSEHYSSNDTSYIRSSYNSNVYLPKYNKHISRNELISMQEKYNTRWYYRALTLHDFAWGENRVEIRFRYSCSNFSGKTASGFSKTTLLISPDGRISGFADDSNSNHFPDFSPYVGSPRRL